tara:strand:- start:225 stop:728 length:504 start_codon:yes stop_codon:yes gene_type:complete
MSKYNFEEISKIDVSKLMEKKGKFNYLSWSHSCGELLKLDNLATWTYAEPLTLPDGSMMVFCTVKAFGKEMTAQLPVIDFKNQAIKNPNSMQLNTAMMRCLAKAIALYGLGLFVFQGEDLPPHDVLEHIENVHKEQGIDEARKYFNTLDGADRKLCTPFIEKVKESK